MPRILQHRSLHRDAAERIGPVEHHEGDARLRRRLHRVGHRGDVGIDARADILQVEDQHFHAVQHLAREGLARVLRVELAHRRINVRQRIHRCAQRLPVEAEDGQPEMFVAIKRHILARLRIAAHAMLGPVKCHEVHARLCTESLDRADQPAIHAGRIGDEPDTPSAEEAGELLEEDINAEFHGVIFERAVS